MECPSCGRQEPRSSEQNKRYWAILALLSEKPVQGVIFSSMAWHEYFKLKFLGADDIKLPNGKILVRGKSTADLDKPEFSEYMQRVEIWALEHGVFLDE
jgi:hypothetical protein